MRPLASVGLPIIAWLSLLAASIALPAIGDVLRLTLPFFGLILVGYVVGKLFRLPAEALSGLNVFIVYAALPALLFDLVAATPIGEVAGGRFVLGTTASTFFVFMLAFVFGLAMTPRNVATATIRGVAGSYSNVGYMGPALTLQALGPKAAVPTAFIFVADSVLLFTLVPLFMGLSGGRRARLGATVLLVIRRIVTHPFNIATAAGIAAAALHWQLPTPVERVIGMLHAASAPSALFAMGLTIALRPVRHVAPDVMPLLGIKLVLHPFVVMGVLLALGGIDPLWIATAVLMASLPPALNLFVLANQYETYIEDASAILLLGTILSALTVTGFLYALSVGLLPLPPLSR